MEPASFVSSVGQLGLGGIVFVIWYFDSKKIEGYKDMVSELMDVVRNARDERAELVKMVREQSMVLDRTVRILDRVEQRIGTMIEKVS